jgi:hypothetical protein
MRISTNCHDNAAGTKGVACRKKSRRTMTDLTYRDLLPSLD